MNILFVSAYLPYPPDSGGRIRTYHLLKWAAEHHQVSLLSFYHHASELEHVPRLESMCQAVQVVPAPVLKVDPLSRLVRPFLAPCDIVMPRRAAAMAAALEDCLSKGHFDLVHFDDLGVASYVRLASSLPTVLSKHNLEWRIKRRTIDQRKSAWHFLGKALAYLEWWALRGYESRVAHLFGQVVVVSEVDRQVLARLCPVFTISVVPNGVDTAYFAPQQGEPEKNSLVFTGAMFWPPNIDAALFLCKDVLPFVREQVPEVTAYIVGHDPPQAVRHLARQQGVVVTGYVEDVRPYMARAALYVVPLRIGSGTRLKILEALAMGKAVVTTTVGREGLDLVAGRDVVVANGAAAFAAAIVGLLQDADRRAELGRAGRKMVQTRYDWQKVLPRLERVYRRAVLQYYVSSGGWK